jgi:hypothetical protein
MQQIISPILMRPRSGADSSLRHGCATCLLCGVAVVDRSRPEVPEQGEADAPGDGEDGAVADRGAQQQFPQRVDDGREGLVLGEPAYPGWH